MIQLTIQFIVALIGTYCFSILMSAPKKMYILCGIGGAITWVSYLLFTKAFGVAAVSFFFSTLILTIYSRLVSVLQKNPVIVFITPGIFPLVPGAGIYFTAYYLFTGDTLMATLKGRQTFVAAGTIALGLLFGFGIPQSLFNSVSRLLQKQSVSN